MPRTSRPARTLSSAGTDELQLELTHLTRRRLLQAGGAAAALAVVYASPLTKAAAAAANGSSDIPNYLVRSTYLDLTDKTFTVDGRKLVLQQVADFAVADLQPNLAENEDAFSLLFRGPPAKEFGSGIKTLNNSEMGSFDVYVGPVNDGSVDVYEVIVNRVLSRKDRRLRPPKPPAAAQQPVAATGGAGGTGGQTKLGPTHAIAKSPVRNITATRTEHGLKVSAQLKPKSRVRSMTGWVTHDGRAVGTASRKVHSDTRLAFNVKTARRVRRGRYDVQIRTVDRRGVESFQVARVEVD